MKDESWIIWLVGIAIAILLGLFITDACGIKAISKGVVHDKEHQPSYYTITFDSDNNPTVIHHPDQWHIKVRLSDGTTLSIEVDHADYDSYHQDDKVNVQYTVGKLSGGYLFPRILPLPEKEE